MESNANINLLTLYAAICKNLSECWPLHLLVWLQQRVWLAWWSLYATLTGLVSRVGSWISNAGAAPSPQSTVQTSPMASKSRSRRPPTTATWCCAKLASWGRPTGAGAFQGQKTDPRHRDEVFLSRCKGACLLAPYAPSSVSLSRKQEQFGSVA